MAENTISSVVDYPFIEAAKFKVQAKTFLIESWLDVEVVYAQVVFQSWLHEQGN